MRKPRKQKKQRETDLCGTARYLYDAFFGFCACIGGRNEKGAGSHEHTPECYTWTETCVHEHAPECYPQKDTTEQVVTPSDAVEPTECGHVCSEESGCITKELNCQYDSESTPITAKSAYEK